MRDVFVTALFFGLTVGASASAQTPDASQSPAPSASMQQSTGAAKAAASAAPLPGANSFAERQARALIESKGYTDVSTLMNDSQGIWRGTATKGQTKVHVSVDFKGHVVDAQ